MSSRKTLDIDFITLRKIRAVDPATNALITPNYILAMDTEGQAQWVNTLSNINTYGGYTGVTGPTGPINPAALLTVTGLPYDPLSQIAQIGQPIPHNTPTVVQLPNVDISNSTTNIDIGILYDPVTGSFTNETMTPLQLLLTWQIAWTDPNPTFEYRSLTTYAEVSGLYINPLQSKYGYVTNEFGPGDVSGSPVQSSSCVIYLDICDKFYIYAKQTNSGGLQSYISSLTSDMAYGYSTKLTITLVQTGPKGDTGPIGPTGPTGPIAPLVTENFMVAGGGDGIGSPDMKFSYNGLIWNPCDLSASQFNEHTCNAIAWSGNLWVAGFTPPLGSAAPVYFAYSSDGINWYASPSSLTITSCNAIAWNGVMWTAGTTGTSVLAYSYNGIDWTSSTTPLAGTTRCNTVAWNGSIWVAGVLDSGIYQYLYSYDGINWLQSPANTLGVNAQVNTVAYSGLIWVAGGKRSTASSPGDSNLAHSYDGIMWTSSSSNLLNNGCNSVAWNGYLWVAGGEPDSSGNTIAYSYDGLNWTDSSSGSNLLNTGCNTVSWNGSIWFAGGNVCPDYAIYSYDGITWAFFNPVPFTNIVSASAARRPLPYVGKTIVPPVLHQYVGPPNGAITYVSPSGGTGLNDIYYSRFVTIHESGPVGTGTLEVMGTVQIGPTASITYDVSNDLVFNTNLLPSTGYAYNLGSLTYPWQGVYVGTGSVHIGPTGTISADPYNLVVNTSFIPDVSDTYTLGNTGQFWKDVYIGTGGVHIGPTGILSGDHSGNLILNTTLLPNTGYAHNLGSLEKPWTGVYVGTGSVHIGPTGTISADPSNLVFNTSLLPDLSDAYTLGNMEKPWKELYVGTDGVFIGPTGSIFAYPSGNLAMGIVNGLFLTNGPNIGEVYDTFFNPPPSVSQSNLATNNFMIAGANNGSISYSYNGQSWTNDVSTGLVYTYGIAWNGSVWIITGESNANKPIRYSSDGINWYNNISGSLIDFTGLSVAWNGSMWIVIGIDPNNFGYYSYDSINWNPITSTVFINNSGPGPISKGYHIAWNGYMWVATGGGSNYQIAYSYDGINWTGASSSIFNDCYEIAWNGTRWVAVGTPADSTATIAYSSDGKVWTPVNNSATNNFIEGNGVAWNGSLWVAVGGTIGVATNRRMAYSVDGISWTSPNTDFYLSMIPQGISWNGSVWVAVGSGASGLGDSNIQYSVNGIDWNSTSPVITANTFYSVASRRPLPFVGETAVPPVFNQGTGPTGGALMYTSPTGTNDMYYSRFLSLTENGGTGTLGVNGTIDIGPTGSIFADRDGNLVMGIVDGLYLTNGLVKSQVYDEYFNPPPTGAQALTNNFTIAGATSGDVGTISYSYNGTTWTNGITTGLGNVLDVAWNGALWVAVGNSGASPNQISYSSDGILWKNDVSGIDAVLFFGSGIAWNGSMWIAVGVGLLSHFGYYSYDGIHWITITSSVFNRIDDSVVNKIAWNGYMWVATGQGSTYKIAYSYDGINWTGTDSSIFTACNGIAWNGTIWVAVGVPASTASIAYSTDGKGWTPVTSSTINNFSQGNDVAWNGSMWVAVGGVPTDSNTKLVANSQDGMTWTNTATPDYPLTIPRAVSWNGSVWTIVGVSAEVLGSSNIQYSENGIDWTSTVPAILDRQFNSVASRRPLPFVGETAVPPVFNQGTGTGGALMYTSPTGTNEMYYSRFLSLTENSGTGTLGVNGTIDIGPTGSISADGSGDLVLGIVNGLYLTDGSNNGTVYDTYFNPVNTNPSAFCVGGGNGTNTMGYSYDGLKWNVSESGNSLFNSCNAIAWNGALWVAGGAGTNKLAYSSDGIRWTASSSGNSVFTTGFVNTVAWNGTIWVAGGYSLGSGTTKIAYSYDGITWFPSNGSGFTVQCLTIAWNGYLWVAGGGGGANQLATSLDGINWTPTITTVFSGASCQTVAWNGNLWVAGGVGLSNRLAYSSDGRTWTASPSGSSLITSSCQSVAWNGSLWVAGGYGTNSLIYSTDGQTWSPSIDTTSIINYVSAVTWNGSIWIAGGGDPSYIVYSYNGINWSPNASGNIFENVEGGCSALASRRPLPFVGETVVPPVFNQFSGTGGALMYTSPTGTNDMYYSRFLSLSESTETLVVNGSIQIGPTGSISYDVSNLIINTNLLPDISNSYTLGSTSKPWAQLFVSPSGIQIGPTGSVVADQSGNLILNTNLLPSTGYAYNLGSFDLPWNELYVGTGSVHIGPTGSVSADQSGNVIVGDVVGRGIKIVSNFLTSGPLIEPSLPNKQLLLKASSGNDFVFLNSTTLGSQASTLSLGQPGYNWNGLYTTGTGIYFSPGPTIKANSQNVIVSSNLVPDVSDIHSIGSINNPWKDIWVGTGSVHVGPTGTISADQSGNLIMGITNNLFVNGPLGQGTVYDTVYNPAPGAAQPGSGAPVGQMLYSPTGGAGEGNPYYSSFVSVQDQGNGSGTMTVGTTNGLLITPDVSGGPLLSPTNGGTQLLLGTDPNNYLFLSATQFAPNQSPTGTSGISLGTAGNYWFDLYLNYPLLNAPYSNALNYFWTYNAITPYDPALGPLDGNPAAVTAPEGTYVGWSTTNPSAPVPSDDNSTITIPQTGIYRITLTFLLLTSNPGASGAICIFNTTTATTLAYCYGQNIYFPTISTDVIINENDQIIVLLGPTIGTPYSEVSVNAFSSLSITLLTALF